MAAVYISKALGCVRSTAFVVRMWEMEWQAVLAFELRVTGRGQTVRLESKRLPLATNESKEELGFATCQQAQESFFCFFFLCKCFLVTFCCPISYNSKSCCVCGKKWMCWSASGRSPAIMWRWCSFYIWTGRWTVKVAGGAKQYRTVVVTLESTEFKCAEMYEVWLGVTRKDTSDISRLKSPWGTLNRRISENTLMLVAGKKTTISCSGGL